MHRSIPILLRLATLLALGAAPVLADCPPDCVSGGGPAATDCFVQFSGVLANSVVCADGDATCDGDGVANGSCTFGLEACLGAESPGCTITPLDAVPTVSPPTDPAAQALAAALATLGPAATGCTAPGVVVVPLKVNLADIKPGKAKLTVTATAGGKKDRDKIRLTCTASPTVPTLATDVQPIFTSRCATAGCHTSSTKAGGQSLEPADAYASSVNAPATVPHFVRVKPGSLTKSLMARKVLGGKFIPRGGGAEMPQGCPLLPPLPGGCLTADETYTILAWIKGGAPQ